jgi:hypothetical protein
MKRRVWIVPLILIVALCIQGCVGFKAVRGSGKEAEEERQVSDFTGVELATVGSLYIELGDKEELRIKADDNLLRYFETQVRGETLEIKSRDKVTLIPSEPIYFYLTVKELDTVALSGLGSVEFADDIEVEQLSVAISGGGNVEMKEIKADALQVNISGVGNMSVDGGEVEEQMVTISGGGNYQARDLESAETEVRVTGVGSAAVHARDHLKVTISGGGSVKYAGNPTVEQNVSGVGHVERIGE